MKSKLLRSQYTLFIRAKEKNHLRKISLFQPSIIWLMLVSLLLSNCARQKDNQSLHFEEQAGQIAVSTEDYAISFVENEVAIELPSGQTVATMNFTTSAPTLVNNKVVHEDIAQQADLIFMTNKMATQATIYAYNLEEI